MPNLDRSRAPFKIMFSKPLSACEGLITSSSTNPSKNPASMEISEPSRLTTPRF